MGPPHDAQPVEWFLLSTRPCWHEPVVLMYRQLCRHYWQFDKAATAFYINACRERCDSDEQGGLA